MKKYLKSLVVFLLCLNSMNSQVDDCSGFEDLIKTACSSLSTNSKQCYYDGTQCREWYTDCADYTPTGNDDKICSQIIPKKETDDSYKKCVIGTNNGNTVCQKVYKTCEDIEDENNCKSYSSHLNLGSGKRCLFVDNKCEMHYESCTNTEINTSDKCDKNIPSTNSKRCKWSDSSCGEENRKCADYIVYSGYTEYSKQCYELEHTSSKICYLNGNNCIETYKACEDYVSTDQTIQCNKIRPLIQLYTNGPYDTEDILHRCDLSGTNCISKERTCEEYNEEEYEGDVCSNLKSTKDPDKNKADCVLEDGHCYDRYIRCEDFNDMITDKDERKTKSSDCTSIKAKDPNYIYTAITSSHYKCSFKESDNNRCLTEKKACSEITDETTCNSHVLDDTNKKCIYKDNACKEEYKNCDTYNDNHGSTPIDETTCKAITPVYTDGKVYQCVYKETSGTKKCEKEEMKCENYSGQDEDYCTSITANDTSKYKCAMVNNHCVTQYKTCTLYNNYISSNPTKMDKSTCESIVSSTSNYRCFLEDDKRCVQRKKLCSEYEGDDEYTCTNLYRSLDSDKICAMENNQCVEKYPSKSDFYYYYFCSEYKGTNKEFCEAIQPYTPSTSTYTSSSSTSRYYPLQPDYSAKCVYGEYGCEKKQKKCEEASTEVECGYLSPEDTNKICVFKSNKCVEQYASCNLYETEENTINQETCESLIFPSTKCKFTAGTGSSKGTCRSDTLKCSDFRLNLFSTCSGITLSDSSKKCVYSNNACSISDKTCLDLYTLSSGIDESETCGAAKTSSDKICIGNPYLNGCVEASKEETHNNDEEKKSSEGNFIGKNTLNKIILMLMVLLI